MTSLALWQQLLLFSNAGKSSGQDDVGEGIRMGLALVLRPIVWTSVVIFILLRNARKSASSSNQDVSFSSVSTLSTKRSFFLAGGIVVATGVLVALFAGVSSASLSSSYGVSLVAGAGLMVLGTLGIAGLFLQTLRMERKLRRTSSIRIGRGEKDAFRKGEWKVEEKAVFVEKPQEFGRRGEGWGDGASWRVLVFNTHLYTHADFLSFSAQSGSRPLQHPTLPSLPSTSPSRQPPLETQPPTSALLAPPLLTELDSLPLILKLLSTTPLESILPPPGSLLRTGDLEPCHHSASTPPTSRQEQPTSPTPLPPFTNLMDLPLLSTRRIPSPP